MKAAIMREYHRPLELVEQPRPEPVHATDVLVRIGGAGVCATDLHALEGLMEFAGVSLPRVLGHENAGWVEDVGSGVSTVAKGDAVLVYPPWSCGLCPACRRGNDMHCARHQFTGLSVDGGFADFVLVPERSLLPLPAASSPPRLHRMPMPVSPPTTPCAASRISPSPARPPSSSGWAVSATSRCSWCASSARARSSPSTPTSAAGDSPRSWARTRSSAAARSRQRRGRGGQGADRWPRRRPRVRLRRYRPDARRLPRHARPRRDVCGDRVRRPDPARVGRARRERARGRREPGRHAGSTCTSSCSCTQRAGSR